LPIEHSAYFLDSSGTSLPSKNPPCWRRINNSSVEEKVWFNHSERLIKAMSFQSVTRQRVAIQMLCGSEGDGVPGAMGLRSIKP
jgi:hypothetical protein